MTYLISQIWLYLLCAGLLGLLLGWIIWGWTSRRLIANAKAEHEQQQLSLRQGYEAEQVVLQEDLAAAFVIRDQALEAKNSLINELDGTRKKVADAKAQIGRLTQAELAVRGEFERELTSMQEQIEREKGTAIEAKRAVEAIRADLRQELQEKETTWAEVKKEKATLLARLTNLEADASQTQNMFERRIEEEQKAKDKLELELRRDRAELSEAKDVIDEIRADMVHQLEVKQGAVTRAEQAAAAAKRDVESVHGELTRLKAEGVKVNESNLKSLEQSLNEERRAKAALELELQRERTELKNVKSAADEARSDFHHQLKANQAALSAAESEVNRRAEVSKVEIAQLRTANAKATAAEIEQVRLAMQQTIDEERRAKSAAEAERSRLFASERDAKAEIERLRSRLSAMSTSGQDRSADADRLGRELEDARKRQGDMEVELGRLRAFESEHVKAKAEKFTTDAPRPAALYDQRPDIVDDLKDVKGIGPVMERILNENGCYHFKQLANFSKRDIEWISQALGSFPDRIDRDDWVGQAQTLYIQKYGQRHDLGRVKTLETTS